MPKMPGAEQLGYVRPRVNTAVASADMSAIGRGAAQLGQGIANLGADFAAVAQENRRQKGVTEASGANAFYAESVLAADREINNSPDYSTYGKTFDERANKTLEQSAALISDPRYREKWIADKKVDLATRRQSILGDADVKQKEAFRVNLGSAIEKDQNIFTDPATPEAEKNAALGRIRDSILSAETTGLLDPVKAKQWRDTYENGSILKEAELRVLNDPGFRKQVLRGDAPAADDLIDAVIGAESSGDPSQVSAKGAAGIMQVMPGTADEIARELGDANYPAGGTEAEKQAYLKNADIGKAYGSHYLDKMLTKYNGDVDAALVAYNGGPARADAWIASGKDDSVIPKETADYYKRVNGRLGRNISFSPADVSGAKTFLKGRTDKDASHIDGLNDGFSVKVSRLLQSAPPEIKDKLGIFSGARSVERQQELWDAALKKYGSAAEARKWVAPPGRSEHNHGNAADLAYNGKSLAEAPKEVVDWLHQNAGAYGLKFPLANENWHIEDASTRGGGALRQGNYSSLSPEQRQNLFDVSLQRQRQLDAASAAELKAARDQLHDSYRLRIANNDVTLTRQAINNEASLDDGQKAILLNSFNEQQKGAMAVANAMPLFAAGQMGDVVDPYSTEGKKLVDGVAAQLGQTVPQDQLQGQIESLVRQTGVVPSATFNGIRAGLTSTNVAEVAAAASFASRIDTINPAILDRQTGGADVQKAADIFSTYTNTMGYTEEQAARKLIDLNDPEKMRQRDALLKSAPVQKYLKAIDSSNVATIFDKGIFSAAPKVGENPAAEAAMVGDYRSFLEESLVDAGGDQAAAEQLAATRFQRIYGTSDFATSGDGVVIKYPPEKAYPAGPDGTHDYVRDQVTEALKAEGVDTDTIYLQADETTEQDIRAGKPARYQVFYEQDGKMERYFLPFYADPAAAKELLKAKRAQEIQGLEQRMIENRTTFSQERAADQKIYDETVGPDWMKAQQMMAQQERRRQGLPLAEDDNSDVELLAKTSRLQGTDPKTSRLPGRDPKTSRLPGMAAEKTDRYVRDPKKPRVKRND